jgi:hypothetical protein
MARASVVVSLFTFLAILLTAGCSHAATLRVPADHARIQDAIDAAEFGDVVLVSKGRYRENVNFRGKGIVLKSLYETDPTSVAETIIDGNGQGTVVGLASYEPDTAVLAGFTLENGTGSAWYNWSPCAGGVFLFGSNATVRDNVIKNCTSFAGGGGILSHMGRPLIVNNVIARCSTDYGGGGGILCTRATEAVILNNEIRDNATSYGSGGGICSSNSNPTIRGNALARNGAAYNGGGIECQGDGSISGNIVSGNSAQSGGGITCEFGVQSLSRNIICDNRSSFGGGVCLLGTSCTAENNTIVSNTAGEGGGVLIAYSATMLDGNIISGSLAGGGINLYSGPSPTIIYCDVHGNQGGNYVGMRNQTGTNGNISCAPLFADPARGDYRLRSCRGRWLDEEKRFIQDDVTSPCIDAGNPAADYSREPSPSGARINLGFDGGTDMASLATIMLSRAPSNSVVASATNSVTITFRYPVNRLDAQRHFSLVTESGSRVKGSFQWPSRSRQMLFTSSMALQANSKYRVTLRSGVLRCDGTLTGYDEEFCFTTAPGPSASASIWARASATKSRSVRIVVGLSTGAQTQADVLNMAGRHVGSVPPARLNRGINELYWNGKSDTGTLIPRGHYLLKIIAKTATGAVYSTATTVDVK